MENPQIEYIPKFSENKKIKEKRGPMKNITINFPSLYDKNIQKLIKMKLLPSRSEAIRIALREFLQKEYGSNLNLLGFFDETELGDDIN